MLRPITWFTVVGLFAIAALPRGLLAADAVVPASSNKSPNIIFILADDLGYGDLGCYGQRLIKTPHLDRLAAEGMRFTQCYSGSTVCAPSRGSFLTGLHCGHAQVRGNGKTTLADSQITVAEVLRSAGYATGLIGKWGMASAGSSGVPNRQGFDYWFGYMTHGDAHNYYPAQLWKNSEQVKLANVVAKGVASHKIDYAPELFTKDALRFVEEHRARPFFLYLAFTQPHANNEAKSAGMEVPELGEYAGKDWTDPERGRAAMISYMDRDVGQLMKKLVDLKLDDNTIVFFSSDNGPHQEGGSNPDFFDANGPLRGIKRDLYDGGIRVPMIVRWPGRIQAGTTSDHICAFWDMLPTMADIAKTQAPKSIDGLSILPTLTSEKQPAPEQKRHDFLYWEFHERGFQQAARMGQWKGVKLRVGAPLELYDLTDDIGEQTNVAAKHPQVVETIETYLKTARTEHADWPIKADPPTKKAK